MSKIVVLNSGGFDSVCLLHHVSNSLEKGNEIHSLHFKYGNLNRGIETKCAKKVCKKLGVKNHVIALPKFKWTSGEFYHTNFDGNTQYLEYRNLVFLSYALSFAESIGATKIYFAVLKSHLGYKDTSKEFIANFNRIAEKSGVEVIAPFSDYEKTDLKKFVMDYNIKKNEYFSCDVPFFGKVRCGECPDCLALNEIEYSVEENLPVKRFIRTGDVKDKKFIELERKNKIDEVRFLLNNVCQLKCKHCFYGFSEMKREQLSNEVLYKALKDSIELGVNHIHFSGKEPLFDDSIFWYTERLNKEYSTDEVTWSVVTNGINIPRFAGRMKEQKCERVFLSVDDVLNTNGVRTNHTTERALDALVEHDIPTEIFIDLHSNNKDRISDIINSLYAQYGSVIKQFYIRTIKPIGNAEDFSLLSGEDIQSVYEQLLNCCSEEYSLAFTLGIEYVPVIKGTKFEQDMKEHDKYFDNTFGTNFVVTIEKYCARYTRQVTLTPDGFLLGCASEVASPDYDKISAGNITEYSMKQLFKNGKDILVDCQENCSYKCSF